MLRRELEQTYKLINMKCNLWTLALLSAGVISLPAVGQAEEKPSSVMTSLASTTLSGYVDTSAQWNLGSGNANLPPYAFSQGKADGFNLNVVKITLDKPIDQSESWSAGYKVDLLAGPDANALATQSTAVGADFAVKQAYVALHAPVGNGLDFKVGVWDTIIGYEVFESVNNPNFTRSYGYTIEPTTHTGVQASYQFCSTVSATVGIADTFGATINGRPPVGKRAESGKTYMASMTFTAPSNMGFLAGSTLTACVIDGYNSALGVAGADETSWYLGASLNTPVAGLKVGASYDYLGVSKQPGGPGVPDIGSSYANVIGLYASYQLTEKTSMYLRGEYASSDTFNTSGVNLIGAPELIETTATLQYDLWKNVLSRLEFRWDHATSGGPAYGGEITGTPSRVNNFILLANVAYKF